MRNVLSFAGALALAERSVSLHESQGSGHGLAVALAIGALMIYPETEWIRAVDILHFASP